MSLKKAPAEKVRTKRQVPPEKWEIVYGTYRENLRLCFSPLMKQNMAIGLGSNRRFKRYNPYLRQKINNNGQPDNRLCKLDRRKESIHSQQCQAASHKNVYPPFYIPISGQSTSVRKRYFKISNP